MIPFRKPRNQYRFEFANSILQGPSDLFVGAVVDHARLEGAGLTAYALPSTRSG